MKYTRGTGGGEGGYWSLVVANKCMIPGAKGAPVHVHLYS